jgi:hypothetical protein
MVNPALRFKRFKYNIGFRAINGFLPALYYWVSCCAAKEKIALLQRAKSAAIMQKATPARVAH